MTASPGKQGPDSFPQTPLVSVTHRELALRMEAIILRAREKDPNVELVLAFDGDGTLWDGDIGVELFEALLARVERDPSAMHASALEALREEAAQNNIEIHASNPGEEARAVLRSLHQAFLEGRYPESIAYAMHAWVFAGWREDDLDAFVNQVLSEGRIDERQRDHVGQFVAWGSARGVRSFVVSASPMAGVRRAAASLGLSDSQILAMTPDSKNGFLEPRITGVVTYGEGKLVALQKAAPNALILGAFGDSGWDAAMMRASRVPVAIQPGPSLLSIADSIPGLVVMES